MPANNENLKYSYVNLSENDQLAVDTAAGKDKYDELSSRLKRVILIWNTRRYKGVFWTLGGLAAALVSYFGFTFELYRILIIPYHLLPFIAIGCLGFGLFWTYRGIYIHF